MIGGRTSWRWYTLAYITPAGQLIECRNLGPAAVVHIETVQRGLGAHSFLRLAQLKHYSQQELDLIAGITARSVAAHGATKVLKYRRGEYTFSPPAVDSSRWSEVEWMNYVTFNPEQ